MQTGKQTPWQHTTSEQHVALAHEPFSSTHVPPPSTEGGGGATTFSTHCAEWLWLFTSWNGSQTAG